MIFYQTFINKTMLKSIVGIKLEGMGTWILVLDETSVIFHQTFIKRQCLRALIKLNGWERGNFFRMRFKDISDFLSKFYQKAMLKSFVGIKLKGWERGQLY